MERRMRGTWAGAWLRWAMCMGAAGAIGVLGAERAGAQAAADSMAAADSSSVGEAAADTAAVTPIPLQTPEDRAAAARAAAATGSMGSAAESQIPTEPDEHSPGSRTRSTG